MFCNNALRRQTTRASTMSFAALRTQHPLENRYLDEGLLLEAIVYRRASSDNWAHSDAVLASEMNGGRGAESRGASE